EQRHRARRRRRGALAPRDRRRRRGRRDHHPGQRARRAPRPRRGPRRRIPPGQPRRSGHPTHRGGAGPSVIAGDSVLRLAGLRPPLTAEGHDVTGYTSADDTGAALSSPEALPDMLVTDVRMPPSHTDEGLRAALHLRSLHPRLPVLVLSQYVEQRYARELFAGLGGGLGYLLKDRVADVEEFLDALNRVAAGDRTRVAEG